MEELNDQDATPEEIANDPDFQDAVRKAQAGEYDHTLFEMWEDMIDKSVEATFGLLTIPVADSIMRQWPWLNYADIEGYLLSRRRRLIETKESLQEAYPKPQELLFQENENDWEIHKESYIDVIFNWTVLTNSWAAEWAEMPISDPAKAIEHAAISDVSMLITGPDGYITQMQHLANFEVTNEEGEALNARIAEAVADE